MRIDLRKPHALLASESFHCSANLCASGKEEQTQSVDVQQGFLTNGMLVVQDGSRKTDKMFVQPVLNTITAKLEAQLMTPKAINIEREGVDRNSADRNITL